MNPVLPDDAIEFGDTCRKAFEKLGGVDIARRAEEFEGSGAGRVKDLRKALGELGVFEMNAFADLETFAASAALCEEVGRVVLPFPVVSVLLSDGRLPFAVVPDDRIRVDHGDVFNGWRVSRIDGSTCEAHQGSPRLRSRLGPFVTHVHPTSEWSPLTHQSGLDVRYWLVLTSFQILGAADRTVELASDHVSNRIQFGKPIATFQAVQFMLADAAVAVAGLRELAHFTLWRAATAPEEAAPDVLALRVHAIDVARSVLRTCQQLHGAAGVCDEYDISVITRHIQPALRLPFGAERSAQLLADAIEAQGFAGLFPHGAVQ